MSGDRIVRINGAETADILDFQVQSAEEILCFEIEREGEVYEVEIERSFGESFGIEFEDLRLRSCNNKCVFCFIHQMPSGLRKVSILKTMILDFRFCMVPTLPDQR